MDRDVEAFEVLGEVLDHVVALGLAVHQDVVAELFLQLHNALDLVLHELLVLLVGEVALVVAGTGRTDFGGLREGADGGGGQRRQVQGLFLGGFADRVLGAVEVGRGQGRGAGPDVGAAGRPRRRRGRR